ncbi:MAG: YdeI/OmpD-associated family protein [Actinomycetota bacterium]|nr:YdeI/OmpD-associated family protein [Actinomycetota bacterium]
MSKLSDLPARAFDSAESWRAWLEKNHTDPDGLWVKIAKKGSGVPSITYDEALDVALCFGWIDGQKGKSQGDYWLQRFSPRRPRSRWSKRNTEKVERLIAEGLMTPAGLREVEQAKADGRWDAAYASPKDARVPPDLQQRLDENERAREFFTTLNSANRYAILFRIEEAKRPETRARRIDKFVAMLERHEKLYP